MKFDCLFSTNWACEVIHLQGKIFLLSCAIQQSWSHRNLLCTECFIQPYGSLLQEHERLIGNNVVTGTEENNLSAGSSIVAPFNNCSNVYFYYYSRVSWLRKEM